MLVRKGIKSDLRDVLELIKELAEYEHELHQVSNTIEKMEVDGFGEAPVFGFLVAEEEGLIIGTAIYYFRYSTWKGKRLYLEDIIVTEKMRGKGIGKQLFDATVTIGKSTNCTGMMWQVLDWNEPAINFYKKYYDPLIDKGWLNFNLQF